MQKQLQKIITEFIGQSNTLTIPRVLIDYTGTIEASLLLSQLLYWTTKSKKDGWVYKSYKKWHEEISLSEYQVRKSTKYLRDKMDIMETKIKKINGNPTLHYRIKTTNFLDSFLEFLKERTCKNSRNVPLNSSGSINTEITTEITTEIKEKEEEEEASAEASALLLETVTPEALPKEVLINTSRKTSTSEIEIQNLPVGLAFLQKMHVKSAKQLDFEINSIINAYPLELTRNVLKNIEVKMQKGSLAYFTPTYLRNAIDNLLDGDQTMDANVHAKVKDFCLEYFKRESAALAVYSLYRKLTDTKNKKLSTKGSEGRTLNARKITNIKYLVETYGEEAFLKAIEKFSEEDKAGTMSAYTLKYVTNKMRYDFEHFILKKKQPATLKKESEKPVYVVPVQHIKQEDYFKGASASCNWLFKCTCGAVVDRWARECPKCAAIFEWEKIVFTDTA
jgi:hypothetical protein